MNNTLTRPSDVCPDHPRAGVLEEHTKTKASDPKEKQELVQYRCSQQDCQVALGWYYNGPHGAHGQGQGECRNTRIIRDLRIQQHHANTEKYSTVAAATAGTLAITATGTAAFLHPEWWPWNCLIAAAWLAVSIPAWWAFRRARAKKAELINGNPARSQTLPRTTA